MGTQFKIGDQVKHSQTNEIGMVVNSNQYRGGNGIGYSSYAVQWPNGLVSIHSENELNEYNPCTCHNTGTCYACAVIRVNGTQLIGANIGPITITLPDVDFDYPTPMHFSISRKSKSDCECGTKNAIGQGHSTWCKCYRKEF